MKKFFLCLSLFISSVDFAIAQSEHNSNLDDLGDQFRDIRSNTDDILSKNLCSGNANITIPLYKYSIEGVNLDLNISYNTGGLTVDESSSIVGLGWTLNCGGFIQRQQRDIPDDADGGYWFDAANDKEPDIYYLSFNNRFYKVMFSSGTSFVTIPTSDIKIQKYWGTQELIHGYSYSYYTSLAPDALVNFKVTDENGNEYFFTQTYRYSPSDIFPVSKIKTYEGKSITFTYNNPQNRNIRFYQSVDQSITNNSDVGNIYENIIQKPIDGGAINSISLPNGIDINFEYNGNPGSTTLGSVDNCETRGSSSDILSAINIKERTPPPGSPAVKYSYLFNHAFFHSPDRLTLITPTSYPPSTSEVSGCGTDDYTRYRLKLKSIDILGYDNTLPVKRYYTFDYVDVPLPERLYGMRDYYGYANNKVPIQFIPCRNSFPFSCPAAYIYAAYPVTLSSSFKGDRPCGTTYTSSGIISPDYSASTDVSIVGASNIKKITNEKGGQISFDYSTLYSISGMDCGGVVIDKINYYDGYSHSNDFSYQYSYSNGVRYMAGHSFEGQAYKFNLASYLYCTSNTDASVANVTRYDNTFNVLNSALNGSRYGFRNVTETLLNNSSVMQNKTTYTFSAIDTEAVHGITDISYFDANSYSGIPFDFHSANKQYLRDWSIGLLINTQKFDVNNNLLQYIDYKYQIGTLTTSDCHGIHINKDFYPYVPDAYGPYTGFTHLTGIYTRNYISNSRFTETYVEKTYTGNILTKSSYTNSRSEKVYENYYYNHLWSGTYSSEIAHLNSSGVKRILYSDKWKQVGGVDMLVGLIASGYGTVTGNIIRPTFIYKLATNNFNPILTLSGPGIYNSDIATMSAAGPISSLHISCYNSRFDDQGFGIENTDFNGIGTNTYNANVIDNETGDILAEAKNAQFGEIAYCGFESDYSVASGYTMGNLTFNTAARSAKSAVGRSSFHLSSSAHNIISTTGNLVTGKKYVVSFWGIGTGFYTTDGSSTHVTLTPSATYTSPGTTDVWTLYKGTFTAAGTTISVYGEGDLDEFKLHPATAMMYTHSFAPLLGKIGDVDPNDNIMRYNYDNFGNKSSENLNGNVISKTVTSIQH